jgi:hypothetical protein
VKPHVSNLVLAFGALWMVSATGGAASDERRVEHKRVVVRVDAGGASSGYQYLFVDHDDGEPVVLEAELADRGYLGVLLLDLTPDLRQHFGAPAAAGVMISRVERGSPAAAAGIVAGDVLVEIDGTSARSATDVVHRITEGAAGVELALDLLRGRDRLTLSVRLAARQRRQLDLGGLLKLPGAAQHAAADAESGETIPLIELDPESMERALALIREHFDSSRWQQQMELLGGDRRQLEVRIGEIELRLRELDRQLEDLPE